jgi:signal transduction histidine kinase/putative methionine-R-sulfoxide reductase with GAF domain
MYGVSVAAILVVTAAILLMGMAVRVQAFSVVYVLLVGLIAWRYGRGPALAAGILAVAVSALLFTPNLFAATASDLVRLVVLLAAALAVAQVIHLQRSSWRNLEAREAALAGRLRLLEEISRRIVESLNAEDIVRTVAEQAQRVIDYHHFRFYRYDEAGERLILATSVARAAPYDAFSWENVAVPLGSGITGLVARTRMPILVPDASRDPRMFYPPGTERLVEAVLAVPMVAGDRFYGVLSLARLGAGSLTSDDQSLMEAIGAQAALALANAERFETAEQTIAALAAIESLETPATDAAAHDLHQRITTTLVGLAHADAGGLRLRDSRDQRYYLVEAGPPLSGVPPPRADPVSQRDAAWLSESRAPSFMTNPQSDSRLPSWAREAAAAAGVQTTVFLPLRSQDGLLGWVALHWKRPIKLGSEALHQLQLVAAQATITVQSQETLKAERSRAGTLAQLEQMRREFMQIASHELRTPLSVIRGYASLLEDGSLGSVTPEAGKALGILSEKATEMGAQIERMLFLARLEDSKATYVMDEIDLGRLAREAITRVRPQLALRGGAIQADLPSAPVLVVGDAERLGMAVDNLLENAAKFTIEPPRIEVRLASSAGEAEVQVRDNGIGIPHDAIPHLFEKFYRVDDPQLRVGGTGIGLYLVRQVVEAHGGRIAVESKPNQGTTFRITLPLVRKAPPLDLPGAPGLGRPTAMPSGDGQPTAARVPPDRTS